MLCHIGIYVLVLCHIGICALVLCQIGICVLVLCQIGICVLVLCQIGICVMPYVPELCQIGICVMWDRYLCYAGHVMAVSLFYIVFTFWGAGCQYDSLEIAFFESLSSQKWQFSSITKVCNGGTLNLCQKCKMKKNAGQSNLSVLQKNVKRVVKHF